MSTRKCSGAVSQLTLLHEEPAEGLVHGAMSATEFRRRYRHYQRTRGLVMRQIHRPGECLYLDFPGARPYQTDLATGDQTSVELFVAVLGGLSPDDYAERQKQAA